MGVTYNLATKTVKNTGETEITLIELITLITTLAPDEEKTLTENTEAFKVNT